MNTKATSLHTAHKNQTLWKALAFKEKLGLLFFWFLFEYFTLFVAKYCYYTL